MASQISTKSTQLPYTFVGSNMSLSAKSPDHARWDHLIESFSKGIDDGFAIDEACHTTLKLSDSDDIYWPNTHTLHELGPATPLKLSPMSAASTPPSPSMGASLWDSPQTPIRRSDQTDFDLSTPLTQPMTSKTVSKTGCSTSAFGSRNASNLDVRDGESRSRKQSQELHGLDKKIRNFNEMLTKIIPENKVSESSISLPYKSKPGSNNNTSLPNNTAGFCVKTEIVTSPTLSPSTSPLRQYSHQRTTSKELKESDSKLLASVVPELGVVELAVVKQVTQAATIGEIADSAPLFPKLPSDVQELINQYDLYPPLIFNRTPVFGSFSSFGPNFDSANHQKRNTVVTPQAKTKHVKSKAEAAAIKKSQKAVNDLKKVLEHILPFDITTRLIANSNGCVASQVKATTQCLKKRQGCLSIINANVEAIQTCIDNSDYFALPHYIEKLIAVVTCVRHQKVALSEEIAKPRMETLRKLIVTLSQSPEEIVETFENWLSAISNRDAPALLLGPLDSSLRTTWTVSLSRLLNHIMPAQIHNRVRNRPTRCVVSGCRELHSRRSREPQEQRSIIDEKIGIISRCINDSAYTDLPGHFESLISAVMCCSHRVVANSRLKMLRAIISDLANLPGQYLSILRTWISAIAKCTLPPVPQTTTARTSSTSKAATKLPTTGTIKIKAGNTAGFHFVPYQAGISSDLAIAKALRAKIEEPLTKADEKEGFVYMFWDRTNFGKVKIGRTNNLERRLKDWNRKCKTAHRYHRSSQDGKPLEISHVQRIETLMHIELVNFRRTRACQGCGQNHIEWFEINEAEAVKILHKWQNWVAQNPYAPDHRGKWTLRPEMLDTVSEVCKPVLSSGVSAQKLQTPRPRPKTQSKRRPSRRPV